MFGEQTSDLHAVAPARRTPSLVGRARMAQAGLAELDELRRNARRRDVYLVVADRLREAVQKFQPWPGRLTLYQQEQFPVSFDRVPIRQLRTQTTTVAEQYQETPASIIDNTQDREFRFWRELDRVATVLEGAAREAWGRYCQQTLQPPVPHEQLAVLEQIAARAARVRQVRALVAQADQLRQQTGSRPADFERPRRLAEEITQAVEDAGGGLSEELFAFIQAATGPSGADLDQLTDDIKEGLRQLELESLLRVRLDAGATGWAAR